MKELRFVPADQNYITSRDIVGFFKKEASTICVTISAALILAVLYVGTAEPKFTASAQILIDPGTSHVLRDNVAATDTIYDTARVEGQLAVLRSETIAQKVIDKLNLRDDPEVLGSPPSLISRIVSSIRGLISHGQVNEEEASFIKSRVAIAIVQGNLDIKRVGTSYAIDIAYTSKNPNKAAVIANAVADAYVDDQVQAASKAARQGSEWLERRIDDLRVQLNVATRDVQLFRNAQSLQQSDPRFNAGGDRPSSAQSNSAPAPMTLTELESRAQNFRKMYETYLQAFTDTMQRQSFPVSNTRIITPATRPFAKSHPRTVLILVFALMLGALSGFGIAFLRYSLDDSVRTSQQVEERVGVPCITNIPVMESTPRTFPFRLLGFSETSAGTHFREVEIAPFSPYSSAIKLIRTALENKKNGSKRVQTIGITSALPREGKTTLVGNIATAFALKKKKVLIIDLDVHTATLSRSLAPDVRSGLSEILHGAALFDDTVRRGKIFKPDILPIVTMKLQPPSYDIFTSERMTSFLSELEQTYDYIFIDMPPLSPVVEGISIGSVLDGLLVVSEWGQTPMELLQDLTRRLREINANILGVLINKVDPALVNFSNPYPYYDLSLPGAGKKA